MSTHEEQIARDATDLERFGYKQELKRDLGTFSSFAVAFSYISPSTGIFTLFFLGMSALGGFLFWTWPVVAGMQLIVALNFAELSSHFPVAGSVYQWTKYLANRGYAWITGWFYLFAGILTVASVCATLPIALLPMLNNMFDWNLNTELGSADQRIAALVTLALITILNIYGVKVVAVVNNTGVFFEILGMVVFAVFLAIVHNNQGLGVIFDADKSGNIFEFPAPLTASFFLVGMFMSLYVIYGFDTASTLAEETRNPRVGAPKAVIASVIGSFIIGAIFLWGVLIAVPDMGEAVASFATGPQQVIEGVMSTFGATLYLFVVVAAIFVCCMSILTSTIRLAFGMARDNQLPFSKTMSKVSPTLHTPVWTCVIVGGARGAPVHPVRGRGGDRGRRDGVDLPQLPAGEPGVHARAGEGVAEDQGALLPRRLGQGRERRGDPVGSRDAAELPHAVPGGLRLRSRTPRAPRTCGSSRTRSRSRPTTTSKGTSSSTSRSTS